MCFFDKVLIFLGVIVIILFYVREFVIIYILGVILNVINVIMNNIFVLEGNIKISMILMFMGVLLNIIFELIFIYIFYLGIKGLVIVIVIV